MNARAIIFYISVSLLLLTALMLVSGAIAYSTPGDNSRLPLLYSAFITLITGLFPLIFVRRGTARLHFRESNMVVVCSKAAACLFGTLPFLLHSPELGFLDAMFESVSGFTTTGASILDDVEALPRGLQFWRISTAWVGGVGIVTLFSTLIRYAGDRSTLSGAEISAVARSPFLGKRTSLFANRMLIIYILLTLITFFALKLTGLGWFDSATHAMSACSTCGFSTRGVSIAAFDNPAAEIVLTLAMLTSGLNFGLIFLSFLRGGRPKVWQAETSRWFLGLACLFTLMITVNLRVTGSYSSTGVALRTAAFQVASITTTTGFATQDTSVWPAFSMTLLWLGSIVCGCSGSTSGGIKMDRLVLSVKGLRAHIRTAVNPTLIHNVRADGVFRSAGQVNNAFIYIFCYLLTAALFTLVNVAGGLDFVTGLTASVACVGNVGPGFGELGSMANYADIPAVLKITGMMEMFLGRLEIFPVLYLFGARRSPARARG